MLQLVAVPALRALRYRNFRLFFGGQTISLIGTWMTRLATSWLVYRLTHSAFLLGVAGFAGQIPTFLLAPIAGVWVDRWNRRRVLIWTQILLAVLTLTLAALTLAHIITIPEIMALAVLQGIINAFDLPGRQAFLIEMVEDRSNLGSAIAMNSTMVNVARLAGPSLAGMTIAAVGEGYCFLADGISYFAVIASLIAMRMPKSVSTIASDNLLEQLKDGWNYVSEFPPARTLLIMYAVVSFVAVPYMVLMPVIASVVLHGNAGTLGMADGRERIRRADVGGQAGGAEIDHRLVSGDHAMHGASRRRAHRVCVFTVAGTLDGAHGARRLRHDAGIHRDHHRDSNDRSGGQTRARDELLDDGVYGRGAIRQRRGRSVGGTHRRRRHARALRRLRGHWRVVVLVAAQGSARTRETDLSRVGPAAAGVGRNVRRGESRALPPIELTYRNDVTESRVLARRNTTDATIGLFTALAVGLVWFHSLVWIFWEQSHFDSDHAVLGLMAKHLSQGRTLPLVIYGQTYLLGVQAWMAAPLFWLFGPSVAMLRDAGPRDEHRRGRAADTRPS